MDESEQNVENKPVITPEEFTELRTLQAQQTFLQAQGYQIHSFIANLDAQYKQVVDQMNAQLSEVNEKYNERSNAAREQLSFLENELSNQNNNFRERFQQIVSQYGFEDVESVAISDTEPHYISPVTAQPAEPLDSAE